MAETLGIVFVLGLLGLTVSVAVYGVTWLLVATPLVRWCLLLIVGILALRVVLLPFTYIAIWWSGYPSVTLEQEVRAATEFTLTTRIVPTRGSSRFTLLAEGSLANHSNRVIERISVSCRANRLLFGDYESAGKTFTVMARPGETKGFTGEVADDLTGVV